MNVRKSAMVAGVAALVGGAVIGLSGTANAVPIAVVPTPLHPGVGPVVVHYDPLRHPFHPFRLTAPVR
jgi:hypothetical protein